MTPPQANTLVSENLVDLTNQTLEKRLDMNRLPGQTATGKLALAGHCSMFFMTVQDDPVTSRPGFCFWTGLSSGSVLTIVSLVPNRKTALCCGFASLSDGLGPPSTMSSITINIGEAHQTWFVLYEGAISIRSATVR